jgi:inner membrane protein
MQVQTHLMSGWCVADFFDLTPKERFFAMIAASAADLDGLGLIVSTDYYVRYHHVLGHNLLFAVIVASFLTFFSVHRVKVFWLFFALFHLHLLLDYLGSGPEWGFYYLWPFSNQEIQNPWSWDLTSWQDLSVAAAFLVWVIVIAFRSRRTPLEFIVHSLDRKIVRVLGRKT